MPDFFFIIVLLLFVLAISDLIVGVSNDAVNFLNSAIGSKVAPRYVIMIVASLGIIIGATFSSGMMEIARKGIFNPDLFYFSDVMIIFLAVMLTDVILLDLFNTLGLPTSTTVSIVFELLGAAMVMAMIKVSVSGAGWSTFPDYINSSQATTIISGIFLSVGIAFFAGMLIQYLSRLIFSFQYQKRMNLVGGLWGGIALSALSYFLLIKGIKGASFVSASFLEWVKENTLSLLAGSFLFWTILMQTLVSIFKINILRIIVLFGTFSLAMAFAGNDLVNFIGVPIAGFESFLAWKGSGTDAGSFSMDVLKQDFPTKTYLLLLAGIIMILTLWFSRKARSVTETEVNLGRQSEGLERFSSNLLARGIVRYSYNLAQGFQRVLPNSWLEKAEGSFQPELKAPHPDRPAFDLVRASVNLTIASMLISLATSYKLPLSTTYVTFMVAMGTSLADRAWGRDSAVYRVAGVLSVIGGWFFTAIIAFSVSGFFAFLINRFGGWAIAAIVFLAAFLIFRSFMHHRRREKAKERLESFQKQTEVIPSSEVMTKMAQNIATTIGSIRQAYHAALEGLLREDRVQLKRALKTTMDLKRENQEFRYRFYHSIKRFQEKNSEASRVYLLIYDLEQDILQSVQFVVNACDEHVENVHRSLEPQQAREFRLVEESLDRYLARVAQYLQSPSYEDAQAIMDEKQALFLRLENLLSFQVKGIKEEIFTARNSLLFFSLLLETKDLIAVAARFVKLFHRLQEYSSPEELTLMAKPDSKGGS